MLCGRHMAVEPTERERANLARLLEQARAEDFGAGDVTGAMLPAGVRAEGVFVAREELVFCGGVFLGEIAAAYDAGIETTVVAAEGQLAAAGATLAAWSGPARAMLAAERVALNFLQRLSGVATLTRKYVDAVAGTDAVICDTRKTVPGWRELDKYAVRVGGGTNHRRGLYDAVLVKDNHLAVLAAAGSEDPLADLAEKLATAREGIGEDGFVEVEVDTPEPLKTALRLPVDFVLLDNFSVEELAAAVSCRDEAGLRGRTGLEASGGVSLETAAAIARAGVDRISVGALTHSAAAVDIALDVHPKGTDRP